jgi:hypothetical protein
MVSQLPEGKTTREGPTPFNTGKSWAGGDNRMRKPSHSNAVKHHVPHAMPEFESSVFKLGQWPVNGLVGKPIGTLTAVPQQGLSLKHLQDVMCIRLPIGGAMHIPAGFDPLNQLLYEWRLYQSPFVVSQLVPRVGKKDMDAAQAVGIQHVLNDIHSIVLQDADVVYACLSHALEQGAHARFMHFTA